MLISEEADINKKRRKGKDLATCQNRQFDMYENIVPKLDEDKIRDEIPTFRRTVIGVFRQFHGEDRNHDEEVTWIPAVEKTFKACPVMEDRLSQKK